MLKLIALKSCIATLQFQTNHTLSMMDWNPDTHKPSHFRYIKCAIPAIYAGSQLFLEGLLEDRPNAAIVNILTHDDRFGFQPVVIDNEEYIDEFGLPVYIGFHLDWYGGLADIDERLEGNLPEFLTP